MGFGCVWSNLSVARTFPSFNALDRVPMFMGVPLLLWLVLLLSALVLFLLGIWLLGGLGMFLPILLFPVALFLKQLCATDDQAMRIFGLEMKFRLQRKFYKEFNNTLTFLPSKYSYDEKTLSENFR